MEKKTRLIFALALAAGALVVFGGTLAFAEESGSQADATAASVTEREAGDIPVSVAGMVVWIDEETGELRPPTAGEAASLKAAMEEMFGPATQAAPTPIELDDGTVIMEVGLSQLDFSVATIDDQGQVSFGCLNSAHQAEAHVHSQTEAPEDR